MGLVRPSGYEVLGGGELHRTMGVDQAVIDKIVLQSGSFGTVPDFPDSFSLSNIPHPLHL